MYTAVCIAVLSVREWRSERDCIDGGDWRDERDWRLWIGGLGMVWYAVL